MSERTCDHFYTTLAAQDGWETRCEKCGEPAPSAPPAAPLVSDFRRKILTAWDSWGYDDTPDKEDAIDFALDFAAVELARAEQELEQVKAERDGWKAAEEQREKEAIENAILVRELSEKLQRAEAALGRERKRVSMAFVQSKYRNPQQADYVKELQARVEALSAALRDLEDAVRVFREYAGRHEGMHDSALTVCSLCNASYVGAESRLDQAQEAACKLLEEKGSE